MKKLASTFIFMLALIMLVSACSSGGGTNKGATNAPANTDGNKATTEPVAEATEPADETAKSTIDPSISGEVTFWTFLDNKEKDAALQKAFNEVYPNIKLKTIFVPFGDLHDKLQTTLAAGKGAPDVALVEQGQFPRYSTGNVLEDLLQPQYDAGKYQSLVSEYNWNRWSSIDGTKLLGMPWDVTPAVTYYRADIFEELGLPSDPAELGEYIQEPENFFTLAQTLKANGKYSMEWRDSPVHWLGDSYGYYDSEMNWVRNTDEFVKFLDISKQVNQLKIAPHDSIYSDKGKQRVKKGESPMYVAGTYGARDLEANFPDQKGKWRATTMPFGLNVGMGGSTFVIPAQSSNKDAAWAFVEFITTTEAAWKLWIEQSVQPDYKNITSQGWYLAHTNPYLGDQEDYKFYDELAGLLPVRRYTRLDGMAWPLWVEGVLAALDKNIDSKTAIQQTQENIENKLKAEKDKLIKELQQ
ncbi:multiple sugar transport system substrate-binding protein [Paenibacillus castaneae]|uniref:ABC transporter substrate-binding protein n=1 Tax=Paenibacillus castaneae TaxID=474957 RepID=UPI000C9CADCC|nr:extracellular solute-binding protein [Paenibacillus castaneae]NIK79600.1 multiple sugar transport system substrate-binding protein [Paenibacillus castaneae]